MKNNLRGNTLILIFTCFYMIACSLSAQLVPSQVIALSQQPSPDGSTVDAQIWKVQTDYHLSKLLFKFERVSDKPISQVFLEEELDAIRDWQDFIGHEIEIDTIYPTIFPHRITLSPNQQQVIWLESISWEIPKSSRSFGISRIVLLNLTTKERKILYEIAKHPDGAMFAAEKQSLGGFNWSPDGQHVVFVEGSTQKNGTQAKIINVDTGVIEELGVYGGIGLYSGWSLDGDLLIDKCNALHNLVTSWGVIGTIDWSPNSKVAIFSAAKNGNTTIADQFQLYALDIDTEVLKILPLDENLSYSSPKWSPDGKFIGMNAASTLFGPVSHLFIFDVAKQEIIAHLEGKRAFVDWYWSDDIQSILLTMGSPPDTPRTIELFHWQENRTEVIPFPEGVEDGVAIGFSK